MNELRQTLFRLIVCGFAVALCASLFPEKRLRRLIRFVGGCALAVAVLQPLMDAELFSFLERLRPELPQQELSAAQEKNELLLKELVEEQTAEYIEEAARELGCELRAEVQCEKDDASGLYLPARVTLRGLVSAEQRSALSERLENELAIMSQDQRWVIG